MSKIKQLEALGYKICKGSLYHGKPQELKDGELFFYIETPSGELHQPYLMLDDNFYVSENKIPCTRREIIIELFNPSEEDICYFENKYGLRTESYLNKISKSIGLKKIRYNISDSIKNDTTKEFSVQFINANATISYMDSCYYVQLFSTYSGELIYTFEFVRKPNFNDVTTAYDIASLKADFIIGKYKEIFKCRECGQTVHWLDGKGDFKSAVNRLEDKWCGMC